MSTWSEETVNKCHVCMGKMKRVHLKNPYIDDFSEDCQNESCYEFMSGTEALRNWSRSKAKEEHEDDN